MHVPEDSHSADHAVNYLLKNKENAEAIFERVHHDHVTKLAHFETNKPAGYHGATEFTLIHTGHDEYELRKKQHHFL